MSRTFFEETQTFRESRWVWALLIAISLATILPLMDGLYWQLAKGEPWGDQPMSDGGLITIFLVVLVSTGIMIAVMLSLKLDVQVNASGLQYRFVPIKSRWQTVSREEILNFSIENKFRFFESGGFGYHRNRIRRTQSMRIKGGNHLAITLKNGHRILLGTQNPGTLDMAVKKMMYPKEMN